VTLKGADFQALDGMGRSANQMGVAAAVFAADWFNKFLIVRKAGGLAQTRRAPTARVARAPLSRSARPHFAVPSPKTRDYDLCRRWQGKGSLDVPEADRATDARWLRNARST
jgi:hypothetical protein